MIGDFISGGQLSFHSIRMFKQVSLKLTAISVAFFLATLGSFILLKTPAHDWYALSKLAEAKGTALIPWKIDPKITFTASDGVTMKLHYKVLLASEGANSLKARMIANIVSGSILGGILAPLFFFGAIGFLISRSRKMLKKQHIRGAKFEKSKQVNKAIVKHNKKEKKTYRRKYKKPWVVPDIKIANVTLPLEADTQHLLIIGAPGSGKTNFVLQLLEQVRAAGYRAIVFDIEGAFIPHFYRPGIDKMLAPFDERGLRWSYWKDNVTAAHHDDSAAKIVPDKNGCVDDFWLKAGRVMLSISASQFAKKRKNPLMRDFLKHLFASSKEEVEALLKGTMGQAMVGKDLEKGTKSILLTLVTYCSSLLYLKDDPAEEPFSIRDWVANETDDSWLFISTKEEYRAALAPIITMWMDIALSAFLSLPENYERRFWFYGDELSSLNKQTSLLSFLERSRKRGGCFVGSIHDPNQLADIYGKVTSNTQKALLGTTLYFYTNNDESAQRAAHHLGQEEFIETRKGRSMGANDIRDGSTFSQQTRKDFVVMPSEITSLKKREAFFRTSGGWPVTKLKFKHKVRVGNEPAFIERDQSEIEHVLEDIEAAERQIEQLKKELAELDSASPDMEAAYLDHMASTQTNSSGPVTPPETTAPSELSEQDMAAMEKHFQEQQANQANSEEKEKSEMSVSEVGGF